LHARPPLHRRRDGTRCPLTCPELQQEDPDDSLEAALAEAKKRQKLVFWYVSTINRSPMDRKTEIDRYSMSGPFFWPPVTSFLNEHFIPVRMAARAHGRGH
jgi:hypothetical protein